MDEHSFRIASNLRGCKKPTELEHAKVDLKPEKTPLYPSICSNPFEYRPAELLVYSDAKKISEE